MAAIAYEDFSGGGGRTTTTTDNPFDVLIESCNDDAAKIQSRYEAHRTARNKQQETLILNPEKFDGWKLDPVLVKLDGPRKDPEFTDPRHCLVLWARPSRRVRELVGMVQERLRKLAPRIWIMPPDCLHMTALELAHSKTASEIQTLVDKVLPHISTITDHPSHHHTRLIKPLLSFDAAALALSFSPAATGHDAAYTYHHLRRDLHRLCSDAGVQISSRYIVPSAHLTVARFNSPNVFAQGDELDGNVALDLSLRTRWIEEINAINQWLVREYWPKEGNENGTVSVVGAGAGGGGMEWIVGEERGLDFRRGTLWYGGGESVWIGKGF